MVPGSLCIEVCRHKQHSISHSNLSAQRQARHLGCMAMVSKSRVCDSLNDRTGMHRAFKLHLKKLRGLTVSTNIQIQGLTQLRLSTSMYEKRTSQRPACSLCACFCFPHPVFQSLRYAATCVSCKDIRDSSTDELDISNTDELEVSSTDETSSTSVLRRRLRSLQLCL